MSLVGLEVNATGARAVLGADGVLPQPLALDGTRRDLPMTISLQARAPEVGRAGLALCRESPHLVCEDFLARLGTTYEWVAGRHRLDAARAATLAFERLRSASSAGKGVVLALPPYLGREQAELVGPLAVKAKLPFIGSVPSTIAAALAAFKDAPWSGLALVIDADDHALTCSVLSSTPGDGGALTLLHTQFLALPRLSIRAWKVRLIDGIADRCIRHSRRDPRDSGAAEQRVFEQLEDVFDGCRQDQMVEVVVQGGQWCQNLILRPEEVRSTCLPLLQHLAEHLRELIGTVEGIRRVLVTAAAWKLPGLREVVQDESNETAPVLPLHADAAAQGAHELAGAFQRGDLPREHLDAIIRCPLAVPPEPGKAAEKKKKLFRF